MLHKLYLSDQKSYYIKMQYSMKFNKETFNIIV